MAMPKPFAGHYRALGVPPDATTRAIERAFAAWKERLRSGQADAESYRRAESAYHVLSAPAARARHDRQLGLSPHPAWAGSAERSARVLCRYALAYLSGGRPDAARSLLQRATHLAPGDPLARSYLALAMARTRVSLHEAARHGEYAVERRPAEPAYLFNLAEVYAAAGLTARSVRARALAWRATAASLVRKPGPPL
jgi:tetratricopeptide (TPR) repeat protein